MKDISIVLKFGTGVALWSGGVVLKRWLNKKHLLKSLIRNLLFDYKCARIGSKKIH